MDAQPFCLFHAFRVIPMALLISGLFILMLTSFSVDAEKAFPSAAGTGLLKTPCDEPTSCASGRCLFEDCDFPVLCLGGRCEFRRCKAPACPGGRCTFQGCSHPTCAGGRCDFIDTVTTLKDGFCYGEGCSISGEPATSGIYRDLAS